MLKNDRANLTIALLIAVSLWLYVLLDQNPLSNDSIKSVPINFMHAETLQEDGLVILSKEAQAISINYSGHRSDIDLVKMEDFRVSADLEGLKEGENTVRIMVSGPEGVTIDNFSPQKIKIHVDKLVSEEKPVKAVIVNQNSDDNEPHIVQVSKDKVLVTGAQTLVNKVSHLMAPVDESKVGDTMKALNTELIPVDKDGNEVFGVTLEKERVSVTTVLLKKKTVSLVVPVTGNDNIFITRDVSVPKSITIKGTEEELAMVSSIECEPVDVSRIYENTSVDLVPVLPENVEVTIASENLRAYITVIGATTVEYIFDDTAILLEGANAELVPVVDDMTIVVKVSGSTDVISGMNSKHFTLYADISGLGVGEHVVPLHVVCTNNILELEYNPSEITVLIEEKTETADGVPGEPQEGQVDEQEGQGEF
ncbi:MAG: hypothetical protein IKM19_08525 [Firmicutes bacterium]|nr:hypothetical protein [Bacillota bacterium]